MSPAGRVRVPNPFKPSAGSTPPVLVGRGQVLADFRDALDDGPGAPGRLQFVTGARGVGKTVLLTKMGSIARGRKWVVLDETATSGMIDRLARAARRERIAAGVEDPTEVVGRTYGLPGGWQAGATFAPPPQDPFELRQELTRLLGAPLLQGAGVMITVDEIHTIGSDELDQLAAVVQHLIRDEAEIVLVMAGIPQAVDQMIADNAQRPRVSTFLRRAERLDLGAVDVDLVQEAFEMTVADFERSWAPEVAQTCAEATGGYPFMIQLVGYHVWRIGREGTITADHADQGIAVARRKIGNLVHAPALQDLSDVDRTILVAMCQDEGPSSPGAIAARIGKATNYLAVYRRRLESAGMVQVGDDGRWRFATPELRQYLRDHAAHLALNN